MTAQLNEILKTTEPFKWANKTSNKGANSIREPRSLTLMFKDIAIKHYKTCNQVRFFSQINIFIKRIGEEGKNL